MNSVINLPDGQVNFFEEFELQKNCEINLLIKMFLGLVEMTFELVNVSDSLPKWQAVKMTFFAPWTVFFKIFLMEQTSIDQCAFLARPYASFQPYLLMHTVLIQPFMVFQQKIIQGHMIKISTQQALACLTELCFIRYGLKDLSAQHKLNVC